MQIANCCIGFYLSFSTAYSKAASALLKFTLSTLYSKVCKREIPFYKQGNRLYFSRNELLDWIKDGRKKTLIDIDISADTIINRMNKKK